VFGSGRRALAVVALVPALAACGAFGWLAPERPRRERDIERLTARQHRDRGRALARSAPGAALAHLELADQAGALASSDRALLAGLLERRGRARLALDDAGAAADLERAVRLGARPTAALRAEAALLEAAVALRRAGAQGDASALAALGRARALAPKEPRLAIAAPASAPLGDLAQAIAYLDRLGARRAALARATAYVERGGRDGATLARFRALFAWWHGAAAPVPFAARDAAPPPEAASPAPPPAPDDGRLAADLAEVAAQWSRSPARADRAIAAQLARDVLPTARALALSALLLGLGDPPRAARVADRALASSPALVEPYLAVARAAIAAADPPRAEIYFTEAAARSGDGGATLAAAARWTLGGGQPLAALALARAALALTPADRRDPILGTVAEAQRALGRR
jgi:hypothetical protein